MLHTVQGTQHAAQCVLPPAHPWVHRLPAAHQLVLVLRQHWRRCPETEHRALVLSLVWVRDTLRRVLSRLFRKERRMMRRVIKLSGKEWRKIGWLTVFLGLYKGQHGRCTSNTVDARTDIRRASTCR